MSAAARFNARAEWRKADVLYGEYLEMAECGAAAGDAIDELRVSHMTAKRDLAEWDETHPNQAREVSQKPGWNVTPDVRLGDFRTTLSDLVPGSVDVVLTDPPYPAEFLPLWSDLGEHAAKWLKPGGVLAAMSGQIHLPEVMRRLCEHLVRRIVTDDTEAVALLRDALKEKPGPKSSVNNIHRTTKGTSRSYSLQRLHKDAPQLHAEVLAGRLSAHGAMVQAGFRLCEHLDYHWTVAYLTPGGQAVQVFPRRVNTCRDHAADAAARTAVARGMGVDLGKQVGAD
jgi:16S rRNA G966 N2-methylase RsmD